MTARLTLPQQRAIETYQVILDAGARVFARRGFGQATVADIADEAGISMGALYHHFASKEELFKAIAEKHICDHQEAFGGLLPSGSLRETIERFTDYWLNHCQREDQLSGLFMECWAQAAREPWAREAIAALFRHGTDLFRGTLRAGQEAGVVRRDIDLDASATVLLCLMQGIALRCAVDMEGMEPAGLGKALADLMDRYLRSDEDGDGERFRELLAAFFAELEESETAGR
jgi:AcrR family transcriptional regulator